MSNGTSLTSADRPLIRAKHVWAAPALAALVYPVALIAFYNSERMLVAAKDVQAAATGWVVTLGALLMVYGPTALAFWVAYSLGRIDAPTPAERRARRLAHLAFACPPLFTCIGVILYLLKLDADYITWALIWVPVVMLLMTGRDNGSAAALAAPAAPAARAGGALRVAHGVSAAVILAVFLVPHLVNHLTGLVSPQAHARVMNALRSYYRADLVEPALVALFVFQVLSGLALWAPKTRRKAGVFETIQTTSALYLAIFITSHMTAVFVLGRAALKIDTGWGFATGAPQGLLGDPWNVRLIPHYSLAVWMLVAHAACGLRQVLLAHRVRASRADRIAWIAIALGAAVSALILTGMLGAHLAPPAGR